MKVTDIANEIYLENDSPTDTSIPSIAYWIRTNVGKLNTLIYENFYVDSSTFEIFTIDAVEIGEIQSAIIKTMYKVYRVELDSRKIISSMRTDSVLEAKDQEFSIKRVNKSEVLKTLSAMKNDALKELRDLVHNYRSYYGEPSQVAGDDTEIGHYVGVSDGYTRNVTMGGGN